MGMTVVRIIVVAWSALILLANAFGSNYVAWIFIWNLGLTIFLGVLAIFSENLDLKEAAGGAVGTVIGAILIAWIGGLGFLVLFASAAYMFRGLWQRTEPSPNRRHTVR